MTTFNPIVARLVQWLEQTRPPVGTHLPAQQLADQFGVSRSPVNQALAVLHERGWLRRQPQRGYYVDHLPQPGEWQSSPDEVEGAYFRLAEDILSGEVPPRATEVQLRQRYGLSPAQLSAVLRRVANEGWGERLPGYGWAFTGMLTTPESLLQSYRLRLALEPAALLEPGYHLPQEAIDRCRNAENHLLQGGIVSDTPEQLHERGVRFHEALVEASGNPFFIDAIKRVNRVRRLLSYRSTRDRSRFLEHCQQHLAILDLLERGRNEDASRALAQHLRSTLKNLADIRPVLAGHGDHNEAG